LTPSAKEQSVATPGFLLAAHDYLAKQFKSFAYDELVKRDKVNLDIFWLKDDALEESANLPAPEVIAQEITDDPESGLGAIHDDCGGSQITKKIYYRSSASVGPRQA